MSTTDEIKTFLEGKIKALEDDLRTKEALLAPLKEELAQAKRALAEFGRGTAGSSKITDAEIVAALQGKDYMSAPEIAKLLGFDTRGLSRRFPRMVDDGLLEGSVAKGYRVPRRSR